MVRIDPELDWDNLEWLSEYSDDPEYRPNEHIISLNRHLKAAIRARLAGARGPLTLGKAPQQDYYEFMSDAKHQYKFSFGIDANLHPCHEQVLYWGEPVALHRRLIQAMYDYVDRHMDSVDRNSTRIRTVVTQRLAPGIFKDLDAGWGSRADHWGMSPTETVCEIVWANESPALALAITQKWAAISNCITIQVWIGGKSGDIDCEHLDLEKEEISFLIMTQAKASEETHIYRYGQAAEEADVNDIQLNASRHHITEHGDVEIILPSAWFSVKPNEPPLPVCLEAFKRAVIFGIKEERSWRSSEPRLETSRTRNDWMAEMRSLLDAERDFLPQTAALSPHDKSRRLALLQKYAQRFSQDTDSNSDDAEEDD